MHNPLVSVVMPAYNCAEYIVQAVHSVTEQIMDDLELIVVDDASTDSTPGILQGLARQDNRIVILQNECNMGVAQTRNLAIGCAAGQYIAFLDSDDLWAADKLCKQLRSIQETGCDFSYTAYSFIDESGRAVGSGYSVPQTVTFGQLLTENVIGCSTVLCKASLLKQYPLRAEYAHEDYVLWLELLRDGYTACGINEPLMRYRVHESNRSGDKKEAAKNRWLIYRKFLGLSVPSAGIVFLRYALRGIRKQMLLD